jgi:type I restriction enzyme S subunit
MNSYPTYKASGIEWLGDIPEHWNSISLKHLLEVKDGTHDTPAYIDNISEGYPLVTSKDVSNGELDFEKCKYISSEDYIEINNRSNVEYGDLIMPMIGTIGSPIKVKTQRPFSIKNLALFKNNKLVNVDYLCYVIGSNLVETQFDLQSSGGVQGFVALDTLRNLKVFKISFIEQTAIANYLDDKTSKLDQLIKNKKAQIAQLKEIRQIEINTAVTKGLNPTAKLKPSGIEWLGDVPEHWEVKRLKQIVSTKITDGPHTTPDFVDEGVPFISASAINHNRINFERFRGYITEELDAEYSEKVKPQRNDIFIVKSGATTGRIACVETDMNFNIWSPLALVRSNPNRTYYKYIFFQLQSQVFKTQIELGWSFGTQENIGMGILECLFLAVPQQKEQTAIANYLDEKTSKLDQLVNNLENQIAQLQEVRKIEIFNAVTGKIKVA